MRQPVLLALVATAVAVCAAAVGAYLAWKHPAYAEVVSVEPVKQVVTTPEKICTAEPAARRAQDEGSDYLVRNPGLGGRVVSGMGRLPVRSGSGGTLSSSAPERDAAQTRHTAQSAAAPLARADKTNGAAARKHCTTASQRSERVVGYDVRYRLHGRTSKIRMDYDPGKRIPVKDGKLVLRNPGEGSGFRG